MFINLDQDLDMSEICHFMNRRGQCQSLFVVIRLFDLQQLTGFQRKDIYIFPLSPSLLKVVPQVRLL